MANGCPDKRDDARLVDGASSSGSHDVSEAKRLAARRRFLVGGAAALPVIVAVTAARGANEKKGVSVCMSINPDFIPENPEKTSDWCFGEMDDEPDPGA
jgi:hypothetical protein